jgi:hypothetical protein
MEDSYRNILLSKVDRDSATVGIEIPDTMDVQGEKVPLRRLVFDICSKDDISDEYSITRNEIKVMLRRERNDILDRIENDESMSRREGKEAAKQISQIDRALGFIRNSDKNIDLEVEIKKSEAKSTKRWKQFIDKITMD